MQHILKAICKSRHWHLSISIDTAKFYFSLTKIFWKNETIMTNTILVLNYLASVSLCYTHFSQNFFIHSAASNGVSEKKLYEFLEYPSISISKSITCLIWWSPNYLHIYSLFGLEIYVLLLNEKWKIYKGSIRSAM